MIPEFISRKPDIVIEVYRPTYFSSTFSLNKILVLSSRMNVEGTETIYRQDLLNYTFSESINGTGTFSFSCTAEGLKNDKTKTVLDLIDIYDFVKIYEFGVVRFCGFITDIQLKATVSDTGVMRMINVNGASMNHILSTLKVNSNARNIPEMIGLEVEVKNLLDTLSKSVEPGKNIDALILKIVEGYRSLSNKVFQRIRTYDPAVQSTSLALWELYDLFVRFKFSDTLRFYYPIALSPIGIVDSSLWNIFKTLVPPPVYEVFGKWEATEIGEEYRIYMREVPFDLDVWATLPITELHASVLTSVSLRRSDKTAFSYFIGTLSGSYITQDQAKQIGMGTDMDFFSSKMWSKYGYKPMEVEFKFFDKGKSKDVDQVNLTRELCRKLRSWYDNGDLFFSGEVSFITTPEYVRSKTGALYHFPYPTIGERVRLFGGEFYIESSTRSWSYLGSMTTNLVLTRGAVYTQEGIEKIPETNIRLDTLGVRNANYS